MSDIPVMSWDDWPKHPTWRTERQHVEKKLIPTGEPVAQVWYKDHYILLFDIEKATPKVLTPEQEAQKAKAAATAKANRTCPVCGRERDSKIVVSDKYGVKMCASCHDKQDEIVKARDWLSRDDVVILDTETTGLDWSSRILSISVIDTKGTILLNTYIKPDVPIDESLTQTVEGYYGEYEAPTAFAINGISNEMVKDAPDFPTVYDNLRIIIEGKLVLCYNVDFDRGMLESNQNHFELAHDMVADWHCVMNWFAMYHGEYDERHDSYRWVKLTSAVNMMGAEIENAHDAHGDTMMTLALIRAIAARKAPLDAAPPSASAAGGDAT